MYRIIIQKKTRELYDYTSGNAAVITNELGSLLKGAWTGYMAVYIIREDLPIACIVLDDEGKASTILRVGDIVKWNPEWCSSDEYNLLYKITSIDIRMCRFHILCINSDLPNEKVSNNLLLPACTFG